MKFYLLDRLEPPHSTGQFDDVHKWGLPGAHCPSCNVSWASCSEAYPSVDLSNLPERAKFEESRLEEDFEEFEHLRELVRPLVPPGVPLRPGSQLGPLVGEASGVFGPVYMREPWMMIVHSTALARLQAEGLRGLNGYRTELTFRQKPPPDILELEIVPAGVLHPDCLPPGAAVCQRCGRLGMTMPKQPILAVVSLPEDRDLFRLRNFGTMIIGTERFADTLVRLGLAEEVVFRELPVS
jgi:uncharacterized double-CXXCG motif protein